MKLKPCPFCGKDPVSKSLCSGAEWIVKCTNPKCSFSVKTYPRETEQNAIKLWNTRYGEKNITTLENRLKYLLQSEAVRMYDEKDPRSHNYKRDILELDHLVFDSKREEKTAHWDINIDGYYPFCSHCCEATQYMSPYCPNCGRKMVTRRYEE